jgi:hypothetical protein
LGHTPASDSVIPADDLAGPQETRTMSAPTLRLRAAACLLVVALLPTAVLQAAGSPNDPAARPAGFWAPLQSFWAALVQMACDKGIIIDPNGCPR